MSKKTYYAIIMIIWLSVLHYFLNDQTHIILNMLLFVLVFILLELVTLTDKFK